VPSCVQMTVVERLDVLEKGVDEGFRSVPWAAAAQ
jgi:hypothetical protein